MSTVLSINYFCLQGHAFEAEVVEDSMVLLLMTHGSVLSRAILNACHLTTYILRHMCVIKAENVRKLLFQ